MKLINTAVVGASASAWTPASLSSLVAWFDPSYGTYSDAGTTPAVVGDPVYRWVSRNSGSIYAEQATLANRPILRQGANGKYYLEFDGTNDRLVAPDTSLCNLTGDFTLAGLCNRLATSDSYIFSKQKTSAAYNGYGLGSAANKLSFEASDGTYSSKSGATTWGDVAGWKKVLGKRATTTATVYYGGASDGSGAVQGGDTSFAIALRIGAFSNDTTFWNGSMSHLTMQSAAISDVDRALLDTFLDTQVPT